MTRTRKPTWTQQRILTNAANGRRLDDGRPFTQSAAAGWGCSVDSCIRAGWLDRQHGLTDAGMEVVRRIYAASCNAKAADGA